MSIDTLADQQTHLTAGIGLCLSPLTETEVYNLYTNMYRYYVHACMKIDLTAHDPTEVDPQLSPTLKPPQLKPPL